MRELLEDKGVEDANAKKAIRNRGAVWKRQRGVVEAGSRGYSTGVGGKENERKPCSRAIGQVSEEREEDIQGEKWNPSKKRGGHGEERAARSQCHLGSRVEYYKDAHSQTNDIASLLTLLCFLNPLQIVSIAKLQFLITLY